MPRRSSHIVLSMALLALLAACGKKPETDQAAAGPAATASGTDTSTNTTANAATAEDEAAKQADLARKQAQLDYATMEDGYINDPNAQWASSAKASSTFGDQKGEPSEVSQVKNVTGKVDGNTWTNNNQTIGFDWVQVGFDKPVNATELRFVFPGGKAVQAVSKVELIEADGTAHVVWSGVSDVQPDQRGDRTWFVRKFDATPYKAAGAKLTIANNLESGYKELDAVQIVGQ